MWCCVIEVVRVVVSIGVCDSCAVCMCDVTVGGGSQCCVGDASVGCLVCGAVLHLYMCMCMIGCV